MVTTIKRTIMDSLGKRTVSLENDHIRRYNISVMSNGGTAGVNTPWSPVDMSDYYTKEEVQALLAMIHAIEAEDIDALYE